MDSPASAAAQGLGACRAVWGQWSVVALEEFARLGVAELRVQRLIQPIHVLSRPDETQDIDERSSLTKSKSVAAEVLIVQNKQSSQVKYG